MEDRRHAPHVAPTSAEALCLSRRLRAPSSSLNVSPLPGKAGSFGKSIVAFCDYEKQFFGAIIRCALGKRASAFCSFLPSPIKRCPSRGLYKEGILKSFCFFYRSHYSLPKSTQGNLQAETSVPCFIQYLFPSFVLNNPVLIAIEITNTRMPYMLNDQKQ
jgi:hypothetical protein